MNYFRFIACCLLAAAGQTLACPAKVPAGLEATTVGEDMAIGDIPMSILHVTGKEKSVAIMDRVEREWITQGFQVRRNQTAEWLIVSALSEKCLTTLQLESGGGAGGFLAVSAFGKSRIPAVSRPPLPAGAAVYSRVLSQDSGRPGATVHGTARAPVTELREFYERSLKEEGWRGVRAASTMKDGSPYSVLVSGQRGSEQIEVMLWRGQGTEFVINVAELP